jgi:hypothetical protein
MFKGMTSEYCKLVNAEKKLHRALKEKGLFLDHRNFNIMEVFNYPYSDYSDMDEENKTIVEQRNFEKIYVEGFDQTDAKFNAENIPVQLVRDNHGYKQKKLYGKERENHERLLHRNNEIGSTPNSGFSFEGASHHSKNTHRSHNSISFKSSHRLLFGNEYQVEKRSKTTKKDFLCTCNRNIFLEQFHHPIMALQEQRENLYLQSEDESVESIWVDPNLMRSMSLPVSHQNDSEDKILEPLVLERQPLSAMVNTIKHHHFYANPLDKLEHKAFKVIEEKKQYSRSRFPERNFNVDSFGIYDENINY